MDFNELLGSGKLAVDLVGGSVDLANKIGKLLKLADAGAIKASEVTELTAELQTKLIRAQQGQLAQQTALLELKADMMERDRRLELERKYEAFTTDAGTLVLSLKREEAGGEPPHCICPDCAEAGKRSFLQPRGTGKGCNPCNKFFAMSAPGEKSYRRPVPKGWIDY